MIAIAFALALVATGALLISASKATSNPRDDDKIIDGLSTAQMMDIAEIVKGIQP